MIERWLMTIRDHPARPPAMQRHVLAMLALRLNWKSGAGYVSTAQLAADADASTATIKRATGWARKNNLLIQTRRGHRLGNGQVIASEWKLCQGLTGDPLTSPQGLNGQTSRAQSGGLKGSAETHHQESSSSQSSSSGSARHTGAPRSEACKHKEHRDCTYSWCTCGCHHTRQPRDDDETALAAIVQHLGQITP